MGREKRYMQNVLLQFECVNFWIIKSVLIEFQPKNKFCREIVLSFHFNCPIWYLIGVHCWIRMLNTMKIIFKQDDIHHMLGYFSPANKLNFGFDSNKWLLVKVLSTDKSDQLALRVCVHFDQKKKKTIYQSIEKKKKKTKITCTQKR